MGRFSIIYFRGLGLRIRARVWVRARVRVWVRVRFGAGVRVSVVSVASRHTRGPIDNISFGAPVWSVTNHSVVFRILRVFRTV